MKIEEIKKILFDSSIKVPNGRLNGVYWLTTPIQYKNGCTRKIYTGESHDCEYRWTQHRKVRPVKIKPNTEIEYIPTPGWSWKDRGILERFIIQHIWNDTPDVYIDNPIGTSHWTPLTHDEWRHLEVNLLPVVKGNLPS